ncbi:MAG: L,D-transpeptidase [Chloroflexi bacterium]|nr:L,D-transpeptidase [Chloroflexota bacterium]
MKRMLHIGLPTLIIIAGFSFLTRSTFAAECFLLTEEVGHVCDAEPQAPTFVKPEPFANSFLPSQMYVRQKDLSNVYSEPSMGSPIVRNVGDGFLYATVQAITENEGRLWYQINYGEWMRGEDITVAEISNFTGMEIQGRPERPFGWMVVDYWYSLEPGAEPTADAVKLPRYTFLEVYDAVEDEEGWLWYDIGGGRWMRQTYVSLVDPEKRPDEIVENEYWVEIDLYEQTFAAYVGDQMVYAGLVSSGLNRWPTHEGLFQVWDRHTKTKMSGAEGKVDYYFIEDVPHTMFFDNDIALHGAFWHDRFGYKHSHGCVNMPPRDAEWVFYWSEGAPNDLWIYVHTSDPQHYFTRYVPEG